MIFYMLVRFVWIPKTNNSQHLDGLTRMYQCLKVFTTRDVSYKLEHESLKLHSSKQMYFMKIFWLFAIFIGKDHCLFSNKFKKLISEYILTVAAETVERADDLKKMVTQLALSEEVQIGDTLKIAYALHVGIRRQVVTKDRCTTKNLGLIP